MNPKAFQELIVQLHLDYFLKEIESIKNQGIRIKILGELRKLPNNIRSTLKKTVKWSGMGSIDTLFGFLFGAVKGYVYFITIFTMINLAHTYDRWHDSLNNGVTFEIIIWGNELVVETFPKRYEYIDKSKEKFKKFK